MEKIDYKELHWFTDLILNKYPAYFLQFENLMLLDCYVHIACFPISKFIWINDVVALDF